MTMPGRNYTATNQYRYGFNGKELDKETSSTTTYDYGFRIYNPALGKFLSVDPLTKGYPAWTAYSFAMNNPISGIDLDGLEYLSSEEARLEVVKGLVKLKVTNFHNVTRNAWESANENISNWQHNSHTGFNDIGISRTVGSVRFFGVEEAPEDIRYGITGVDNSNNSFGYDPNFKPGNTDVGKRTAKSTRLPDNRYSDKTVSSATPMGARGLAAASIVLDGIIIGSNYLRDYQVDDDIKLASKQAGVLRMAQYDVAYALKNTKLISPEYQTEEALSDITNVVFSGVSNLKNKEIEKIGKDIYNNISTKRKPFMGMMKLTGPSGMVIMDSRPKPNSNYDPQYVQDYNKSLEQNKTTNQNQGNQPNP